MLEFVLKTRYSERISLVWNVNMTNTNNVLIVIKRRNADCITYFRITFTLYHRCFKTKIISIKAKDSFYLPNV